MDFNTFCWNELNAKDAAAAKKFYGAVFGWMRTTRRSWSLPHGAFRIFGRLTGRTPACASTRWSCTAWFSAQQLARLVPLRFTFRRGAAA